MGVSDTHFLQDQWDRRGKVGESKGDLAYDFRYVGQKSEWRIQGY